MCRRTRSSASSSARCPSRSGPRTGTRCSSFLPVVVVHVRRDEVLRDRLDRVGDVAHQVRVAEVEADAGPRRVEILLEHRRPATPRPTAGSGSLRARRGRRSARPAGRSPRRCGTPPPGCSRRPAPPACRGARRRRRAGIRRAMFSAASASRTAACRFACRSRRSKSARPTVAGREALGDRRVNAVQRQPGLLQPLRQPRDRRRRRDSRSGSASRTARPPRTRTRRSAPGAPAQPPVVIEVRGNPEAHSDRQLDDRNH